MRSTGFAGAVLAIVLAMPPMSAVASIVRRESDEAEIRYVADPGERNVLSISRDAAKFSFGEAPGVSDHPRVKIFPSGLCSHPPVVPPAMEDPYLAWCDPVGVGVVTVSLSDLDDVLTVTDSETPSQPPPPEESFPLKAFGGAGDDDLAGGAGNDELQGDGGSDVLSGGEGRDTADFSERTGALFIALDDVKNDGEVNERDNVRPDVECVIGGSGADALIGSSHADCLYGGGGEDTILGRDGDDLLEGGEDDSGDNLQGENGRDTLRGERGEDSLTGGDDEDTLMGGGGADELDGERGGDTLEGGPGGDALGGGEGDDFVYGGAVGGVVGADGDDRLEGGQGFDRLFGGKGNDLLDGGLGADTMNGGDGKDTVTYDGRTTPVSVSLNGMADDGELGENDNVADNVEAITGSEVDDTLFGDHNANSLDGGRGEDRIEADDGRDLPDDGRDRLTAGTESDLVNAHDGNVDVVDCGDDEDLAVADRDDAVRNNCETVDRPGQRQPEVGRYARVLREGEFRLRLPEGDRFFSLTQNVKIPIGATIDPRDNEVRLITARNDGGARQVASVSKGRFGVLQRGRRGAVTKLRLAGRLPGCRGSSTQEGRAKRAARSSPRRLRVAVKGNRGARAKAIGRYSSGASRGTTWLTEDRCDGTLTRVIHGTVRVRDFGRGRTVTVRPGKPYLARAD